MMPVNAGGGVPAVSQGLRGWGRAALYPTALYSQLE